MSCATNLREGEKERASGAGGGGVKLNSPPKRMESFEQRQRNQRQKSKPAPPPPPSPAKKSTSPVKHHPPGDRSEGRSRNSSQKSQGVSEDHSNSDSTASPTRMERRRRPPLISRNSKLPDAISYLGDVKGRRSKEKIAIIEDGVSATEELACCARNGVQSF